MNKAFSAAIEKEVQSLQEFNNPIELYEPIHYLMSLGGKRMRPYLALLSYSLFKEDWEKAVRPALAIEVFHNFTLMHDDIMDKAPVRRGMMTVHEKWNDNIAILSGDVMLVKAYDYLNDIDFLGINEFQYLVKRFNKIAAEVCEGQQFDMNFETIAVVEPKEYLEMIRLKTSVLVGFSMEMGGILAKVEKSLSDLLYEIGENIGLGFQIKDDLLDVYGDPEKFGKQVGGDIISNKKTYLLIRALELAEGETAEELNSWLNKEEFNSEEKVAAVTAIYNRLGIKEETEELMQTYFSKGINAIPQLNLPASKENELISFLNSILNREK
ncbi:MAG: Dimethylallyltranstransferase [Bacteroidota bacterium]|jgi:geranylgeranyl diphosphate synthase type II